MDRAALDVANELNLEYGGFCPKGRLAEDGITLDTYNLIELKSSKYSKRTLANVKISDGSLIIHKGIVSDGTLKTIEFCQMGYKSVFEINLLEILKQTQVNFDHWIKENGIYTLNVAGPRESEEPIYNKVCSILMDILFKYKF